MSDDSANASVTPDPQSIEGLFLTALGHSSPETREAFLNEACGDDAERRRRIEALLRAYDDAGSFLEHSPVSSQLADSFNLEFLTPSDDPGLIGTLGPYEVFEVLGRGGMGIVFRARDPKLNRIVAIKVLAPELAANPNARRRFLREAQAAAAISHPHVVTIHAVDEGVSVEGRTSKVESPSTLNHQPSTLPYLVMECIVGQTLQQKLNKQGSLRLTETLRIGQQVACGLAAAHKQGLIHRDIKPANILLENGVERVKITDFGLARAADDVSITRTGEVSGTPQYMSPEQATGDPIDHRSDLFSLGCVLYAMCTGRSPFRATTLAAAIRRVCDDTPRPIAEINPETPAWLIAIIDQLLEKNPDSRIQSADEVADLLNHHLAVNQDSQRTSKRTIVAGFPKTQKQVDRRQETSASWLGVTPERDRLAMVLTICGLFVLAATVLWAVAGTNGLVPEPPFDQRHSILNPLWVLALLSGVLLVSGFTLGRYLLRPIAELFRVLIGSVPPRHDSSELPAVASQRSPHRWARRLMWAGVAFIVLPWLRIWMRPMLGPLRVETAQFLLLLGFILGLLTLIAAGITKLVAPSIEEPDTTRPVSLWRVIGWVLLSCVGLAVVGAVVMVASYAPFDSDAKAVARAWQKSLEGQQIVIESPATGGTDINRNVPMSEGGEFPADVFEPQPFQDEDRPFTELDANPFQPPTQVHPAAPLQPAKGERTGYLNIDIQDDGLLVALRRKSAFDGYVPGSEQQVGEFGQTQLRLHPGEYELLIRDTLFGWGDRIESLTMGGSLTDFPVRRDLAEYVKTTDEHMASVLVIDAFPFLWDGEKYHPDTPAARLAVNWLLEAYAAGEPDVDEQRLLERLTAYPFGPFNKADSTPPESLAEVFESDGVFSRSEKPVWGNLIVPGENEGTYRLAPLERGMLKVSLPNEGMWVDVQPVQKDPRFSSRRIDADAELEVPPGEYQCTVHDRWVQWGTWMSRSLGFGGAGDTTARTETVSVDMKKTTSMTFDRRLSDYLSPPEPQPDNYQIGFTWFPEPRPDSFDPFGRPSIDHFSPIENGFAYLNPDQFDVVLELLRAYANGQPAVSAVELLKSTNIVDEPVVDEFEVQILDERLSTIIVPGETESTWRLKSPPEGAFGESVDAVEEDEPPAPPMPEKELPAGEKVPELGIQLH